MNITPFKDKKGSWAGIGALGLYGMFQTRPIEGVFLSTDWKFYFFLTISSYVIMRFATYRSWK